MTYTLEDLKRDRHIDQAKIDRAEAQMIEAMRRYEREHPQEKSGSADTNDVPGID